MTLAESLDNGHPKYRIIERLDGSIHHRTRDMTDTLEEAIYRMGWNKGFDDGAGLILASIYWIEEFVDGKWKKVERGLTR